MAFTDAEKTDIRRFCGYPAYGAGAAGFQSWRFYQAYGMLEYRMNNLSAAEHGGAPPARHAVGAGGRDPRGVGATSTPTAPRLGAQPQRAARPPAAVRRHAAPAVRLFRRPAGRRARRWRHDAGGLMDGASLQDRISRGIGTAARRDRRTHDAYRPRGTADPLAPANRFLRLNAAFTAAGRQVRQAQRLRRRAVVRRVRRRLYAAGRLSRAGQRAPGSSRHSSRCCRCFACWPTGSSRSRVRRRQAARGQRLWRRRAEHRDAAAHRLAGERAHRLGRQQAERQLPGDALAGTGPCCCRRSRAWSCGRPI